MKFQLTLSRDMKSMTKIPEARAVDKKTNKNIENGDREDVEGIEIKQYEVRLQQEHQASIFHIRNNVDV